MRSGNRPSTVPRSVGGFPCPRNAVAQGRAYAFGIRAGKCAMSHHINYGADSVSVRISRGCLKHAKYVRLTQVSYQFGGNDTATKILYDNPPRSSPR